MRWSAARLACGLTLALAGCESDQEQLERLRLEWARAHLELAALRRDSAATGPNRAGDAEALREARDGLELAERRYLEFFEENFRQPNLTGVQRPSGAESSTGR